MSPRADYLAASVGRDLAGFLAQRTEDQDDKHGDGEDTLR